MNEIRKGVEKVEASHFSQYSTTAPCRILTRKPNRVIQLPNRVIEISTVGFHRLTNLTDSGELGFSTGQQVSIFFVQMFKDFTK